MKIRPINLLVSFLIGFIHLSLSANNIRFSHLDVNEGLPSNTVRSIIQDHQGYIWIGTERGLARFDGYSVKQYLADKSKPNTIADSYILSLELDEDNTLWVSGVTDGFSRYNRDTDDFTVYSHDENNTNSLSSNLVSVIKKQADNLLWIATDKGLDRFNTKSNEFTHFSSIDKKSHFAPGDSIRALLKSDGEAMWVGSYQGFFSFAPSNGKFKQIKLQEGTQPAVRTLTKSRDGKVWIGTLNGLFEFDPKSGLVEKMQFKENVNRVYSSELDMDGNLWIGTSKHGLLRIDRERRVHKYMPDKINANGLKDHRILSLFLDQSGIMWLGTYGAGIHHFEPNTIDFGSYDNSLNSIACLPSSNIRSAVALDNNRVLLGTLLGVTEVDLTKKECINRYKHSNRSNSLSNNSVLSFLKDLEDIIWVGTSGGLDRFNRKTGGFKRFGYLVNKSPVTSLLKHERLLFAGTTKGMFKVDLEKETSSLLILENDEDITLVVSKLQQDSEGQIWIAAKQGLFFIDKESDNIVLAKKHDKPITSDNLMAMAIDQSGIIWLAIKEKGLFSYNRNHNKMESRTEQVGLTTKSGLVGLLVDNDNNLWVSTTGNGIYKVDKSREKSTNYNVSDGLHSELFNFGSITPFPNGRLLFGGKAGFNWLHPDEIKLNQKSPIVSLVNFNRFGKAVIPHKNYDGLELKKHISETKKLNLSHRDTVFGFDFLATHYSAPNKITYAYQLQGFDQDWIYTNAQNRGVTYNNVGPGEYTFRVKAQTQNGVASENNVALNIVISPAPWLTWWAFLSYFALSIIMLYLFIKRRTLVLEKRAVQLENTVAVRTEELSNEKNKVEQLLSRKNEEFTNISHEFRTPLTLILGPIAQLLNSITGRQESSRLKVVQRNSYRLLRMVDQLLNLETFRIKSITQKSPQPVGKIVARIAEAFSDLAKENEIELVFDVDTQINFSFTPDALEKIVLNLLSNAIKYSKSGDSITLTARRTTNNEYLIKVTDTGIGIPNDKLDVIFERYSRVIDDHSEQVTGSGIGLALVKSLIEAHNGRVVVESELGKGSRFTVYLPIIDEVDSIEESFQSKDEVIAMELMSLASQFKHLSSPLKETTEDTALNSSDEDAKDAARMLVEQSEKLSILIVEDNLDMQHYLSDILTPYYQCSIVSNGQLGFEKAQEIIPDIILSDIMMPVLDGYGLAQKLRSHMLTSHIPIVFLTAKGDKESRLEGWRKDIDEYLTKPFDSHELILRLKNILSIRQILANKSSTKNEPQRLSDPKLSYDLYDQKFLTKLQSFVEHNYADPKLNLAVVAKNIAMSERQVQRKLKALINKGLPEYIRDYRLACSKKLLAQGFTVTQITYQVGFSSPSYFASCFKALYDVTPKQYQQKPV